MGWGYLVVAEDERPIEGDYCETLNDAETTARMRAESTGVHHRVLKLSEVSWFRGSK